MINAKSCMQSLLFHIKTSAMLRPFRKALLLSNNEGRKVAVKIFRFCWVVFSRTFSWSGMAPVADEVW